MFSFRKESLIVTSASFLLFLLVISLIFLFQFPKIASADTQGGAVSFTFDVVNDEVYDQIRPILAAKSIPGVIFAETAPLNNNEAWTMTWSQLKELQDSYHWEVGSHSVNHPYLTQVSRKKLIYELAKSKKDLESHGLNVKTFATPYGDYDLKVLSYIARYYENHRAAWGGMNDFPFDNYKILALEVSNTTGPWEVKLWIDNAVANDKWLVLLFHNFVEGTPAPYEYNIEDFKEIVRNVAESGIRTTTIAENLRLNSENILANGSFENLTNGWANNWSRSSTNSVIINKKNRGSYPNPKNSLKVVGGYEEIRANSDSIEINPNKTYLVKLYENIQNNYWGGAGVYIDEFDQEDNWISGQWLGGTYTTFVGMLSYVYTPFANVRKISIQIYTEPQSKLTLFADSASVTEIGQNSPEPPPPEPPPGDSIFPNYSFENLIDGWASHWSRSDTQYISVDSQNNGVPPFPEHSLKIIGSKDQHTVGSEMIRVDPNKSYSLKIYEKITDYVSGGAAHWVNEYDKDGNWISGQWLGGIYESHDGTITYTYVPNENTDKINLSIFTEAGSNLIFYADSVVLKEL